MKILSEASHKHLIARNTELADANKELKERCARLARRVRELENSYTTLALRVELKGYRVDIQPEIPAKPATIVLRKIAK